MVLRVGRQVGGGGSGAFRTDSLGGHVPGHAEHRCLTETEEREPFYPGARCCRSIIEALI